MCVLKKKTKEPAVILSNITGCMIVLSIHYFVSHSVCYLEFACVLDIYWKSSLQEC